jgi:hypothetical protein
MKLYSLILILLCSSFAFCSNVFTDLTTEGTFYFELREFSERFSLVQLARLDLASLVALRSSFHSEYQRYLFISYPSDFDFRVTFTLLDVISRNFESVIESKLNEQNMEEDFSIHPNLEDDPIVRISGRKRYFCEI